MLGHRPGDTHDVHLLKGVVADERRGHLAGKHDDGNGVRIGGGDTGDRICGPRPGGHESHADIALDPRIAVCRMDRALLVTHKHVADIVGVHEGVVDIDHRAARKAEHGINPFVPEALDEGLCSFHLHGLVPFSDGSVRKP